MDLTKIENIRLALKLAGLSAKKSLGQNFLVDREALESIVGAAKLTVDDTVLEIGPGLGVLTDELVKYTNNVVALEADRDLAQLLKARAAGNLRVECVDALAFNLSSLPRNYKVVSNLPYYITSPLIRMLLEASNKPSTMTLLVQKEVAERIVASPGKMSVLGFSVQYYGQPELVAQVGAKSFYPAPKVDSAVLHIRVGDSPAFRADSRRLFRLVKAGFGEKRKMLRNSLAGGLAMSPEQVIDLMHMAGIADTARAQELSIVEWQQLYEAYESLHI